MQRAPDIASAAIAAVTVANQGTVWRWGWEDDRDGSDDDDSGDDDGDDDDDDDYDGECLQQLQLLIKEQRRCCALARLSKPVQQSPRGRLENLHSKVIISHLQPAVH